MLFTSVVIVVVVVIASDNPLINSIFQDKYLSNCYIIVYALCQEGDKIISKMRPKFDKSEPHSSYIPCNSTIIVVIIVIGAMACDIPKSGMTLFGERLELQYRIASIPIVLLLTLSLIQITVVLILTPALVSIKTTDYNNDDDDYNYRLSRQCT